MKAKKTQIILSIALGLFVAMSCQKEVSKKDMSVLNLPSDYMYTLTIPEIMDIPISDPS